jgi:hypothetical protein
MLQQRETPVAMAGVAALCVVRRPTSAMAAPGDYGYTTMDPRAAPKRDQGRRDAQERRDHGEQLVRRYSDKVTVVVEWAMLPYPRRTRSAGRTRR